MGLGETVSSDSVGSVGRFFLYYLYAGIFGVELNCQVIQLLLMENSSYEMRISKNLVITIELLFLKGVRNQSIHLCIFKSDAAYSHLFSLRDVLSKRPKKSPNQFLL